MTDVNGRTISVGDKAPGGTIIGFASLGGNPSIQVQFDALEVPCGYTVQAAMIVTAPQGSGAGNGWWTCFPKPCNP